jgi:hypothetical protein
MITKILKNTTNEDLYLINMEIPAHGQVFIEHTMWSKLIQNSYVFELIELGTIVVNNGSRDLSISQAIRHMYLFQDESPYGGQHFSYRRVYAGSLVWIPYDQQMLEYQEINLEENSELDIEGEVVIIR